MRKEKENILAGLEAARRRRYVMRCTCEGEEAAAAVDKLRRSASLTYAGGWRKKK